VSRTQAAGLWARLALAATLGGLMTQWPYPHGCGWPLAGYLGAAMIVVLAGIWIGCVSWKLRAALPHVLALVLLQWGIALVLERVLPRAGYAAEQAGWACTFEGPLGGPISPTGPR
jgi:hypothetical protein